MQQFVSGTGTVPLSPLMTGPINGPRAFNMTLFSMEKVQAATEELTRRFRFYQTANLVSVGAEEFADHIRGRLGHIDSESEGYAGDEIEQQRDLSIKFHWGHDHDFGDFRLTGRMADRHIRMLADLVGCFPVELSDFADKEVFDIGCWTGPLPRDPAG